MNAPDDKNPWTTLSSQTVYENPWMSLSHREVLTPAGTDGIYGVVQFKNRAIGILPLDHQYNTWLVGQYRYPIEQYSWEMPEGGGAVDDDPLDAAKRELREETGISASRWTQVLHSHMSNSVSDERAVVFVAQDLTFGEAEPDDTELLVIRKLPFEKALDMVMDGQIADALTMITILKVKLLMDRGAI